jgi:putative MATE family efflux protein
MSQKQQASVTTTPAEDAPASDAAGAPPPTQPESFWRLAWEAVTGSHRDFTKEPLRRAILLLAIPMVLEMIMESVFMVVDMFWVSRLGPDAMATVVITEGMLTIVYSLAMGLSMGVTAVVARRTGERDPEGAARAAAQALWIGCGLAAVVALVGLTLAPQLLRLMGASPAVVATGAPYTRMMLGGNITIVLLFMLNAAFRGTGDATVAMRSLWLANAINIVLGPFLVFGWGPFPQLGVLGAAVATTIGRGTGVLYQLGRLTGGRGRLHVRRRHLRLERAALFTIVRLAGTGTLQMLTATTSWVVLTRLLASFGSLVLAGYGSAIRVVMFALLPSFGMANAAATLVGQNLGAGHPERSEQAVWRAALYNLYFLGTVGLLFLVFAPQIVGIFTSDPEVLKYGVGTLRIVAAGFPFYAYGMVVTTAFNGAGDTFTPTVINFVCFWLLQIPLALSLSQLTPMGPYGVFLAVALAFCMVAVIGVTLFRRGRWKQVEV